MPAGTTGPSRRDIFGFCAASLLREGGSALATSTTTTPLLIGGEERPAADSFPVYDPSNGEVIGHAAAASTADALDAVRAAHEAWPAWAALPTAERVQLALAALAGLESDADERAELLVRENGKTRFEATIDPLVLVGRFHQAAAVAPSLDNDDVLAGPPFTTTIAHVPVGVVTIIFPFNWPLAILGASLPYAPHGRQHRRRQTAADDTDVGRADVAPHRSRTPAGRSQRGDGGRCRGRSGRDRRPSREARVLHRQRGRRPGASCRWPQPT